MNLKVFFINHAVFTSTKTNETYRKLVCCSEKGEIFELFHDVSINVPDGIPLFSPIEITVVPEPYGKTFRLRLTGFIVSKK